MVRQYWAEWVFLLVRWVGWWEIVGLLWAGTIQLFHRFLPINQPNYIHDSTFCRFLHGLVKCFCWSSMFWLKWAKKSVLFFLQKVTCSTEQWDFPNMKGMVLHQSFRPHFFFVYYQERKSDRTESPNWQDEEKPKMEETGETEPQAETWSIRTLWLKSVLPTSEVRYNSGPGGCHVVCWGWTKNGYNLPVCAPKISSGQREVGNFFFLRAVEWNAMVNCSAQKMCTFPCLYLICRNPEFLLGIFLERAPEYM